jgi:hypothetical protein
VGCCGARGVDRPGTGVGRTGAGGLCTCCAGASGRIGAAATGRGGTDADAADDSAGLSVDEGTAAADVGDSDVADCGVAGCDGPDSATGFAESPAAFAVSEGVDTVDGGNSLAPVFGGSAITEVTGDSTGATTAEVTLEVSSCSVSATVSPTSAARRRRIPLSAGFAGSAAPDRRRRVLAAGAAGSAAAAAAAERTRFSRSHRARILAT